MIQNTSCERCGLAGSGYHTCIMGEVRQVDLMLVGAYPNKWDDEAGKVMQNSDKLVYKVYSSVIGFNAEKEAYSIELS